MANSKTTELAFDPLLGRVTIQTETSSQRFKAKFEDRFRWCLCDLCWRTTEYSVALENPQVVKVLANGNAKTVPIHKFIEDAATKRADKVVEIYKEACKIHPASREAASMRFKYCDVSELKGDYSVSNFEDQVRQRMLITEWSRHGKLVRSSRLSGQSIDSAKPSILYCEFHNPRRSDAARRAYQRDHKFIGAFEELIQAVQSEAIRRCVFRGWDIESHVDVRRNAYRLLQGMKSRTRLIDDLLASEGPMTQAQIASRLGISQQAVSAALKRKKRLTNPV